MKHKVFSKTIFVWLIAVLCCFLWGSAFPAIKVGYKLFEISTNDTASIILFAGIRFFLAGILTIVIFSITEKKLLAPSKKALPKIGVLSLFQTIVQYLFFYLGLAYTTGSRASVIQGTNVFIALLVSSLVFKLEKLRFNKIIGCTIGFAGVVLVSLDVFKQTGNASFMGEMFILFSTISYAFSSVFMKKYSVDDNPAMLSGWQFVLGGAVMILVGFAFGGRINVVSTKAVALLLYMAMISAVAYSLWSLLLKYNPVSKVTVCGFFTPIFGFVLSALFAGDSSGVGLIGVSALALVVVGMIIVNYNKKRTL